jgi:hypothetical protein
MRDLHGSRFATQSNHSVSPASMITDKSTKAPFLAAAFGEFRESKKNLAKHNSSS